jgi:hypothetical protein
LVVSRPMLHNLCSDFEHNPLEVGIDQRSITQKKGLGVGNECGFMTDCSLPKRRLLFAHFLTVSLKVKCANGVKEI